MKLYAFQMEAQGPSVVQENESSEQTELANRR